jgi:hypothetical protein
VGERQMLPMQTNRIRIVLNRDQWGLHYSSPYHVNRDRGTLTP